MDSVTKDLLEALKTAKDYIWGITAWTKEQEDALSDAMSSAIARAEEALAAPQPDADGWIPWAGGECPVGVNDLTEVKLRNGTAFIDDEAKEGDSWFWDHGDNPSDIIAYRVIKEPK